MEPLDHVPREFFAGAGSTEAPRAGAGGAIEAVLAGAPGEDFTGVGSAGAVSIEHEPFKIDDLLCGWNP